MCGRPHHQSHSTLDLMQSQHDPSASSSSTSPLLRSTSVSSAPEASRFASFGHLQPGWDFSREPKEEQELPDGFTPGNWDVVSKMKACNRIVSNNISSLRCVGEERQPSRTLATDAFVWSLPKRLCDMPTPILVTNAPSWWTQYTLKYVRREEYLFDWTDNVANGIAWPCRLPAKRLAMHYVRDFPTALPWET